MKKSFFGNDKTVITALFTDHVSVEDACRDVAGAQVEGADAVALQLDFIPIAERTIANYKRIMTSASGLPFMFINYRRDKFVGADDDARQKFLLDTAEAGAEVVDVIGDLYDPQPLELSVNPVAIERQKRLICEIHERGAKVVMSSHMNVFRTSAEILAHLQEQSARGADILKIVTRVDTEEQLFEAIHTDLTLKKTLTKPFIHLSSGSFSRLHRFLGLNLGNCITFTSQSPEEWARPTIAQFKGVQANMVWHAPEK